MVNTSLLTTFDTFSAKERETGFKDIINSITPIEAEVNSSTGPSRACCESSTPVTRTAIIHNDKKRNTTRATSKVDLTVVRKVCPGAVEYLKNQTEQSAFRVNVTNCKNPARDARSLHGVVYGVCGSGATFCQYLVQVPQGMVVIVNMKTLSKYRQAKWISRLYDSWNQSLEFPSLHIGRGKSPRQYKSRTNRLYVFHYNNPRLKLEFQAVQAKFNVEYRTTLEGYMTASHQNSLCLIGKDTCGTLNVPQGHVVMVSFKPSLAYLYTRSVSLYLDGHQRIDVDLEKITFDDYKQDMIFTTEQLRLCASAKRKPRNCLIMRFSFHPKNQIPQRLSSGLYNCSVKYYWVFRRHLDCNKKVECEDGQDEGRQCSLNKPGCHLWLGSGRKCYKLISFLSKITPKRAMLECQVRDARLATLRSAGEQMKHIKLFNTDNKRDVKVLIGLWLPGITSKPFMYRKFFRWNDNTLLYFTNGIKPKRQILEYALYFGYSKVKRPRSTKLHKMGKFVNHFLCERYATTKGLFDNKITYLPPDLHSSRAKYKGHALAECPGGQMTHEFLSCDPKSSCGKSQCRFTRRKTHVPPVLPVSTANLFAIVDMYSCVNDNTFISYTLVCDFRSDCEDNSDESFCTHPPCETFSCSNGQCVSMDKQCNKLSDCLDDSDETNCDNPNEDLFDAKYHDRQKLLIDLDGKGLFTYKLMGNSEPCPDTHYRCATAMVHCLPIYTRCNELYDCPYHEDERDCEDITCPGLYRCRDSTVCVHVDHVCDGWSQCPQRDDEWLCGVVCPPECLCQGHAFLCSQPFPAHLFPQLRYLDARGSGMTLDELTNNTYVINLNLADCSIQFLTSMNFPNLMSIDLSYNKITSIAMVVFLNLRRLQVLSLKGNLLTSLTRTVSDQQQDALRTMDLSETDLRVFDSQILSLTPGLQYLNLSSCAIHTVGPQGFQSVRHLKQLDISGNLIDHFQLDVFRGLNNLELVLSPYYQLCCDHLLPNRIPKVKCLAPQHPFSSCQHLFASDFYRLAFLFLSVLAVLGNVACLISHCIVRRNKCIFMVNLQCANLCMGIYTSVIATAHEMFRSQYGHYEQKWMTSVACKVAGFLWLLSVEVSVLLIFLFTIDILVVLYFPFSMYRFSKRTAALACVVAWLVGSVLASIPLFPGHPHGGQYGQTGICSLAIHKMPNIKKDFGLFQCSEVLNCINCFVICAGQAMISKSMPKHQILVETSMKHVCASVDLKMKIAVTDAMGWFAVTTTNLLDFTRATGSEKLNVFMSILVLPLNSVINPLLCLWHTVTYKQRQEEEERLLQVLRSKTSSR